MTNEILFAAFLFGGLGLALLSGYFGRHAIYAFVIAITIYINIAEPKAIEVFGYVTTLGTALFGVLYFCTDMLSERYGRKDAFMAIKLGIFASVVFHLMMQGTLMAQVIGDDPGSTFFADFSSALEGVFTVSLRVVLASLIVYALIQSFDVWLYTAIKKRTGERYLWLRNNASTFISQGLDTFLFTFLAFYGAMPTPIILEMAIVGYCFKLIVAFCDTGFIYAYKFLKPLDTKAAEKVEKKAFLYI